MNRLVVSLFLLAIISSNTYAQPRNTCFFYKTAIDSIKKYIVNQGPFVYSDWMDSSVNKEDYATLDSSEKYRLTIYLDSSIYQSHLYSIKRVFDYYRIDAGEISKKNIYYTKNFPPCILGKGIFMLDSSIKNGKYSRIKKGSLLSEWVTIQTSEIFMVKDKYAFIRLMLTRGNSDLHGMPFYFMFIQKRKKWELIKSVNRDKSIYMW